MICCKKERTGNFCNQCGRSLMPKDLKLQLKVAKLQTQLKTAKNQLMIVQRGVYNYVENHHKKMAGSTVQYSIQDLIKLLPEDWK